VTAAPRPAADPGDYSDPGDASPGPAPQGPRPHILVVNGRKVRQPVFVIGAPSSGIDLLARALKRSAGFHFTLGQRWVIPVVQAFARRPSISRGKPEAAATVLRDAFAQAWQVTADCCLGCTQQCREAGRLDGVGPCVSQPGVIRYGDASPDLMYCAEALLDAFPDARILQIIRDGRDAVAGMLADPAVLAWFRPGRRVPAPAAGPGDRGRPGHLARAVHDGQVRDALAGHGAPDGAAARPAIRRSAGHLPL
jgi:hypothetical protein